MTAPELVADELTRFLLEPGFVDLEDDEDAACFLGLYTQPRIGIRRRNDGSATDRLR